MTKDLFSRLFKEYSRWDYSYFYSNFIERLPHRFLEGALAANPSLESCNGFDELRSLFRSESGSRWKNPELYPFLNYLLIPGFSALQAAVDALHIHVGLAEVMAKQERIRQTWRLRDPAVRTLQIVDGQVLPLEGVCESGTKLRRLPLIYKPFPSLFSDLHETYRADDGQVQLEVLVDLTVRAIGLLSSYSPEIGESFVEEIATVAYLPGTSSSVKSFSLRNYYIGGIFVSIADPINVAEQFLHEYYHQRIWPWWMVESPTDLPGNDVTVVSPVTGRVRPASVMIQALLIYSSLRDYYRYVLPTIDVGEFGEESLRLGEKRLRQIEEGIFPLVDALREALVAYPASRGLVDFIKSSTSDCGTQ